MIAMPFPQKMPSRPTLVNVWAMPLPQKIPSHPTFGLLGLSLWALPPAMEHLAAKARGYVGDLFYLLKDTYVL